MSGAPKYRATRRRSYYAAKLKRCADRMASVPDVSRGETRLLAEVILAGRHGRIVDPKAALKAEQVLQTLARW